MASNFRANYAIESDDVAPWIDDHSGLSIHRHHHHRPHEHFREMTPPWNVGRPNIVQIPGGIRTGGYGPGRRSNDNRNPLLDRPPLPADLPGEGRRPDNEGFTDWIQAIDPNPHERMVSVDSPVTFMHAIMQAIGQGGGGFGVISRPDGFHVRVDQGTALGNRLQDLFGVGRAPPAPVPLRDDPSQAVAFKTSSTSSRWQDEALLLFSDRCYDMAGRVQNSILKLLMPSAVQEEKERLRLREEERKRLEQERINRERAREEAAKEQKRKEEEEEAERRQQQVEREAEENARREALRAAGEPMDDVQTSEHGNESGQPSNEDTGARPSEPVPRVYTNIRGRQVDITDLQIDPEYLEALPEEFREEVIMQQLAEQRSQAAASGEEPSEINQEFLEALPPEIREEILQQEMADRRRRERDAARREAAATSQPHAEDIDPASFIATLDPSLRQAVLADQPDEILATLGPQFVSEARALPGRRFMAFPPRSEPPSMSHDRHEQDTQRPPRRHIVQMLDKAGIATLLRLMFMPLQPKSHHHLNSILRNVCRNRQNRIEVLSMLLSILEEGSTDVTAVERSFNHLSLRARAPRVPQAPKRAFVLPTSGGQDDVTPLIVIQQCLGTLSYLTQDNTHISWFFLTEHESLSAAKPKSSRKGKSKENRANKFALNCLLSLLERKSIMDSPSCMEQLSALLGRITYPLTWLSRKEKERQGKESKGKEVERSGPPALESGENAQEPQDTAMTDVAAPESNAQAEPDTREQKDKKPEGTHHKKRFFEPPVVPERNLRLVVHILAARECNGKTFRETLSTINNISSIPGAKEIIGKELVAQSQQLSKSILVDLDDFLPYLKNAESNTDIQGLALSRFSPASSDQAKLLRVLTALGYLFDPNRVDKEKYSEPETPVKDDMLQSLYESATFGPLWTKLSECLCAIRDKEKMLNVATILLPLIESLMVVCKNTTSKDYYPLSRQGSEESPTPNSAMEDLFFQFTEDHRKILNELVRQNPKLMSGTFSLLVKNPKVLEFDNKRNYFSRRLHSRSAEARHPHPPLQISVRRDEVFLDSFKSLYFKTAEEMKYGKLNIRFHGEEGVDAGGVTREWFQVLARGMFNPDYALFIPVASDRTTFHPNRLSGVNDEHLTFFKFIGRIIGKALYEGRVLDCHFSRAVYKQMLGKPVAMKDMETLDLDYSKSLQWMLENDITDILTENFAVETDAFGETQVIDLVPNGRNIPVTQENKEEYVQRVVDYRLTGSVQEQLDNFLKGMQTSFLFLKCTLIEAGFHDIIPAELISIFNEQELELLISGLPEIDVDDWRSNTEYHNYSISSPQIQWFWRAVRSFDKEERAKLLQFITGTSKVPLNGFKELEGMNGFSKFNIHRDYGSKARLPSSHTCFNRKSLSSL